MYCNIVKEFLFILFCVFDEMNIIFFLYNIYMLFYKRNIMLYDIKVCYVNYMYGKKK